MAVGDGKFQLYSSITPPLEAGDWRLVASQNLTAETSTGSLTSNTLKVDDADINFRVKSPRYLMPPDQVLSTFPPANSTGSYGSRLPQVVIKRRTLPWERNLDDAPEGTPWLALVLIAEGEAVVETGVDVTNCVTEGVTLNGVTDVEKGNCLVAKKSIIDKVFPTRNDVELLAHAREVDINDTELMMGDDDGFLAVVISNRLPLPAKNDEGKEIPVKYSACLINLEGQFETLLERSPDPVPVFTTQFLESAVIQIADPATDDHLVMGTAASPDRINPAQFELDANVAGITPLAQEKPIHSSTFSTVSGAATSLGATPSTKHSQWSSTAQGTLSSSEVSLQMARDFRVAQLPENITSDPEFRFPILMHWSFTSSGSTTFRSLMKGLDSGLLGDIGKNPTDLSGRLPLEAVESGHVGLGHKTREGDDVRSWYRGPLVPHPTVSASTDRLPLAHSSDQLRIVIPDGREDLSLASAFEVGRLLSLSQPSIIASLMRWRQGKYHAARLATLVEANRPFWENILGKDLMLNDFDKLGPIAGRFLINAITNNPETFLGSPRSLVTAGRPIEVEGLPSDVLALGLGMNKAVFKGDIGSIFEKIRKVETPAVDIKLADLGKIDLRESLEATINVQRVGLVSNSLPTQFVIDRIIGPAFPAVNIVTDVIVPDVIVPDVLDVILAAPDTTRHSAGEAIDSNIKNGSINDKEDQ